MTPNGPPTPPKSFPQCIKCGELTIPVCEECRAGYDQHHHHQHEPQQQQQQPQQAPPAAPAGPSSTPAAAGPSTPATSYAGEWSGVKYTDPNIIKDSNAQLEALIDKANRGRPRFGESSKAAGKKKRPAGGKGGSSHAEPSSEFCHVCGSSAHNTAGHP